MQQVKLMVLANKKMEARQDMVNHPLVESGEWVYIHAPHRFKGMSREIPFIVLGSSPWSEEVCKMRVEMLAYGFKELTPKANR